jgi:rubrerythrin
MSQSEDYLKEAFAADSQIKRKYQAFAAQAEGNKESERTFRFADGVEIIHAVLYQKML